MLAPRIILNDCNCRGKSKLQCDVNVFDFSEPLRPILREFMRLVLMGTGPFAVPSFDRILTQGHTVACVVARPPVAGAGKAGTGKAGTGKSPPESPVASWARGCGLPIETPDSINDPSTIERLQAMALDLMVVCDYGQILSREALAAARLGGINLHGSLLPRHRGAAPVQWSILAGDRMAGVSVIHMTPALDAGPVLCLAKTEIGSSENAGELESRLSQLGVEPTLEAIDRLAQESMPKGVLQDPSRTTRAPRLKKSDGQLHMGYPVRWIDRQIRGLQPWPGVYANLLFPDGKSVRAILHRAAPRPLEASWATEASRASRSPGTLLYGTELDSVRSLFPIPATDVLLVAGCDGLLAIESLQLAGKKPMSAEEFLRGYARHPGMRLEVPEGDHPLLVRMMSTPPDVSDE
jgi:methionyl-tRNA formyltransferase